MLKTSLPSGDGPRSKRSAILDAAVDHFGRHGFEETKWSAVSDAVGIGETALYHYFQSKAHCLFVIMKNELQRSVDRFDEAITGVEDPEVALRAATAAIFDVTPRETLQLRILQNYTPLLARPRKADREEEVRLKARVLLHRNRDAWRNLLTEGMEARVFPQRNSYLLTQAILAQVISVWQWYRPEGEIEFLEVSRFIQECVYNLVMSPSPPHMASPE